jgi:putative NADH-flavin reductase
MANVLVVGASRGIGLETVRQALGAGHRVRALSRSPVAIENTNLEKISGDATDPAMLGRAVAGMDGVIQTLGLGLRVPLAPVTLFSKSTRHLIDAMQKAGVRRLIAVTGLGAGDSRGKGGFLYSAVIFPLVLSRIYEDKDVQEQFIRNSGLDWTIARPGLLTNGPLTSSYRAITEPEQWTAGMISRADVAHFLVWQIEDRTMLGQTPLLIR